MKKSFINPMISAIATFLVLLMRSNTFDPRKMEFYLAILGGIIAYVVAWLLEKYIFKRKQS